MINRMAHRTMRVTPLNDTEKKIVAVAAKAFLENGFSATTFSLISKDAGISKGNIAYYFHTKEDMLFVLIQELISYHSDVIDEMNTTEQDNMIAYAIEIMAQISMCEKNEVARDLYVSAYNHHGTLEFIKEWTADKNYRLLGEFLPGWTRRDFRVKENVASFIELSAMSATCDADFTLEDKIALVVDSMLKLYDIDEDRRKEVIKKILEYDYEHLGEQIFNRFIENFYESIKH